MSWLREAAGAIGIALLSAVVVVAAAFGMAALFALWTVAMLVATPLVLVAALLEYRQQERKAARKESP